MKGVKREANESRGNGSLLSLFFLVPLDWVVHDQSNRHRLSGRSRGLFYAFPPPAASPFLRRERTRAKAKMLRARIPPGGGANGWRRFLASIGGGGGGDAGSSGLSGNLPSDLARRRALALSLWRDYLCLLERLSPEDASKRKVSAAAEIRGWNEEEKGERGEERQQKEEDEEKKPLAPDPDAGVKRLMAAVSFLRATTPRGAGDRKRLSGGGGGGGVFVVRKGELVRVEGAGGGGAGEAEEEGPSSSSTRSTQAGKLSPDEAFRKHRDLMRRQFYGREPPRGAQGRF